MKIGLMGYGKMGKAIEGLVTDKRLGHEIVFRLDSSNTADFSSEQLQAADVIIEFSTPGSAVDNIKRSLLAGVPIVVGTTAWLDELPTVSELCQERKGALLHAPNFSVGVNLFFSLTRQLGKMMEDFKEYRASISETHHTSKLDAPSGTAIHLADLLLEQLSAYQAWSLTDEKSETGDNLPITAHRVEGVPGTHKIGFDGEIDSIEISHTAHSRDGFAAGAVLAAEWLIGKTGIYTMKDVLRLNT